MAKRQVIELLLDQVKKRADSGDELASDYASRMARADELFPAEGYHGSTHDIREFRGDLADPESDWGRGTYNTTSPDDASINYAGEGPDLTNRIGQRSERIADALAEDEYVRYEILEEYGIPLERYEADEAGVAEEIARRQLVGDAPGGVVYPTRINTEKYAVIGGPDSSKIYGKNYYDEVAQYIDEADYDSLDDYEDAVRERAWELESEDTDGLYSKVMEALSDTDAYHNEYGINSVMESIADDLAEGEIDIQNLDSAIREHLYDNYDDATGEPISAGEISSQTLKGLGFEGVVDNTVNAKFGAGRQFGKFGAGRQFGYGMEGIDASTQHIVTFPGFEKNIRSVNAQFDPANIGKADLLGAASPRMLGGVAATGTAALPAIDPVSRYINNLSQGMPAQTYDEQQWRNEKMQEALISSLTGVATGIPLAALETLGMAAELYGTDPFDQQAGERFAAPIYDKANQLRSWAKDRGATDLDLFIGELFSPI